MPRRFQNEMCWALSGSPPLVHFRGNVPVFLDVFVAISFFSCCFFPLLLRPPCCSTCIVTDTVFDDDDKALHLFVCVVHAAQSNDEDYVQWELHLECSSQELIPHGRAGSLQGRQKLYCLTVSQRPLWRPIHSHHWGFSPQSLQHSRRHVSARHLGYFWESSISCHEETFHTHRLEDYIGTCLCQGLSSAMQVCT